MGRRPAILDELPADVRVEEGPRSLLAVRDSAAEALARAGFDAAGGEATREAAETGRRPLAEIEVGGERFLVRRLHHGGLLRWVTGDRYADPARPFRELLVSRRLADAGVPTPEVVAARALRAPGPTPWPGWYLDVVTRRVEGAVDVGVWFERLRRGDVAPAERRRTIRALGSLVGDAHAAGLDHPDLQQRNLLVGPGAAVWVLDLDRAVLRPELSADAAHAQLARFLRAALRQESRGAGFLTRIDLARFLRAWAEARGGEEGASGGGEGASGGGEGWRSAWEAVRSLHGRAQGAHAVAGALERAFGAAPEERDRRSPDG